MAADRSAVVVVASAVVIRDINGGQMTGRFEGSGVMVTGGASGLGEATVRAFHSRGARVLVIDSDEKRGEQVASEMGERVIFLRADVSSDKELEACFERAGRLLPNVRVAVHCAGIVLGEKILGSQGIHDLERFRHVIDVNLVGSFNLLRLAARYMSTNEPDGEGQRGVIVLTASVAAFEGQIGQAAYSASKAGVHGMILPAARELASSGIRVCCIAPGVFQTPMMAGLPEKVRKRLEEQIPFPPRMGRGEEYASLVLQMVSNPMLNGVTVRLDGALRMLPR